MVDALADLISQFETKIAAFVKDNRLPGAAIGIVVDDDLAWSFGHGFADFEAGRTPDSTTLYPIASITKTFTGVSILQLRDSGALALDDPIVRYIPELALSTNAFGRIEDVTIRRLLSHESGLQGDPSGAELSEGRYEGRARLNLARAEEIAVKVAPHAQFKYSNLGYQLLGETVARISGTTYDDYVRANILEPLHMGSTSFEPLPDALHARLATGYDARWLSDELSVARERPRVWAEGGLVSCVDDLAKWVAFHVRVDDKDRSLTQVLATESLREMHRPRYLADDDWTNAVGISWMGVRRGEAVWMQHSGGIYGFSTCTCFRPSERVGVIVLLNCSGDALTLALDLGELAVTATRATVGAMGRPRPMPGAYAHFLGFYQAPELGLLLRVEWRDARLMALGVVDDWRRWTFSPTVVPDAFIVDPGVRESGEDALFLRRGDGRVSGLKLGPVTLSRLDPVEYR
jgi:CubicO group peptidase (beta-lactamase class C family)